jgi:hypothetical protein
MKIDVYREYLVNFSNTKFHLYSFSGSRAVACVQTDGRKDYAKLVGACVFIMTRFSLRVGNGLHSDLISIMAGPRRS